MLTKFTTDNHGNPILELPEELFEMLDWREGDELEVSALADRLLIKRVLGT